MKDTEDLTFPGAKCSAVAGAEKTEVQSFGCYSLLCFGEEGTTRWSMEFGKKDL